MPFASRGNHYHLLVETPEANLARGMRRLNGVYPQAFNRRHRRVGHVLQGRYKAILVDRDAYLLELCRYVVLNPVRARLVADPAEWPWSRCAATANNAPAPDGVVADAALGLEQQVFHPTAEGTPLRRHRFPDGGQYGPGWSRGASAEALQGPPQG
jgi:hypothetical protein